MTRTETPLVATATVVVVAAVIAFVLAPDLRPAALGLAGLGVGAVVGWLSRRVEWTRESAELLLEREATLRDVATRYWTTVCQWRTASDSANRARVHQREADLKLAIDLMTRHGDSLDELRTELAVAQSRLSSVAGERVVATAARLSRVLADPKTVSEPEYEQAVAEFDAACHAQRSTR